jgi:hypothetical protein
MNLRVSILILLSLIVGIGVLAAILTRPPVAPEQEIYVNGVVLTMDAENTIAEAVLIRGGQIEAVGSSEALLSQADDDTVIVDLRGRALIPADWQCYHYG